MKAHNVFFILIRLIVIIVLWSGFSHIGVFRFFLGSFLQDMCPMWNMSLDIYGRSAQYDQHLNPLKID